VIGLIERGQERGDISASVDAVAALDAMAGAYLVRALTGLNVGAAWRRRAFEARWQTLAAAESE
jgi:hypothetical protein